MARYLMTHSLLSSWLYLLESPFESEERNPLDEFMQVLRREPTPTSDAMRKGIVFEDLVTAIAGGEQYFGHIPVDPKDPRAGMVPMDIRDHQWYSPAKEAADIIRGGIIQYVAKRSAVVDGVDLLMYGRLDVLKAGSIFDIKFTSRYEAGKYFDSTQHPMYMFIVPEANSFSYLASNGSYLWQETYQREETGDILVTVSQFLTWLKAQGLDHIYYEKWEAK